MPEIENREPLVSVIIMNWNEGKWIEKYFDSLKWFFLYGKSWGI